MEGWMERPHFIGPFRPRPLIQKDVNIGDKKYYKSYQQNYIIEKKIYKYLQIVFYKFVNIQIQKYKVR